MAKRKHPSKEIEKAIRYAELKGWRRSMAGNSSHAWGRLLCPEDSRDGCQLSIWSTPSSPDNFAKLIRKRVDNCPHE